jgi:hypothetical protein
MRDRQLLQYQVVQHEDGVSNALTNVILDSYMASES